MARVPHLVVVQPGSAHLRDDGHIWIDSKSLVGLRALAQRFPGELTLLVDPDDNPPPHEGGVSFEDLHTHGLGLDTGGATPERLRTLRADVALVPLVQRRAELVGVARHTVVVAEHTGGSRAQMALASRSRTANPVAWARIRAGFAREGRRLKVLAARSDAVQCNGAVAWAAYGRDHANGLLFYDHRLTGADIEQARRVRAERRATKSLRLAFSGRLIDIKGPSYAVDLAAELERRHVPARLTVYGEGPLLGELAARAPASVDVRGMVDFRDTWIPEVTSEIDVMVLPYVQSDPAGTYAETLGLGCPILGFPNAAWLGLHTASGGGWSAPMRSVSGLADAIERLSDRPDELAAAGRSAAAFMSGRGLEQEFDRRAGQLVDLL